MVIDWIMYEYIAYVNQFKIFLFLQIHILNHLITIFSEQKTLNMIQKSSPTTIKKCLQINYKIVSLFICRNSKFLIQFQGTSGGLFQTY
jgi:hypothetical protein